MNVIIGVIGVCAEVLLIYYFYNNAESWRYFIAVVSKKEIDHSLEEYMVSAATWVVFSGEGTGVSIQELVKRINTEWMPSSGYAYGDAPELEVYFNEDPQNTKYEIWVPVKKTVE